MRGDQPVSADSWIARLEKTAPDTGALPTVAMPLGEARVLDGKLLTLPRRTTTETRFDALLTRDGRTIRRYSDDGRDVRWHTDLPFDEAQLIGGNEDELLLWSAEQRKLVSLATRSGAQRWATVDASEVLEEVGDPAGRERARPQEQRRFMRMIENGPILMRNGRLVRGDGDEAQQLFTAVGPSTVVVADHLGRVAGIERRTGRVLWRLLAPTERVRDVAVDGDTVALAGLAGVGTQSESGAVTVLDLLTGEPVLPTVELKVTPRWLGFAGDGLLLLASEEQLAAYRVPSGAVAWRMELPTSPLSGEGWLGERSAILLDSARIGHLLEAESGQLLGRLNLPQSRDRRVVRGEPTTDRWYVLTTSGLVALDERGKTLWRDAIADDRQQRLGHVLTQQHVVLLARGGDAPDGPGVAPRFQPGPNGEVEIQVEDAESVDGRYRVYVMDRQTGVLVGERPLKVLPEPLRGGLDAAGAIAQPGRVLIPTGEGHTVLIPGAE